MAPKVVVVGAGPCGATLALQLARAGWAVTLVERTAPGGDRPYRGEGLMPSGVAALEAMGLWPLPAGVHHRPMAGWGVVLERRTFFTANEPLAGDQGCWLVDQASLLAQLRMQWAGWPNMRVLEGVAVRSLPRAEGASRSTPGRVAGVELADGMELTADLVVACDGRHGGLRQLAGLTLQEEASEQVLWFRLAGPGVEPLERWLAGRFWTVVDAGVSFALFAEAAGAALRLGWVAETGEATPTDGAGWRESWAAALPEEAGALVRALPESTIEGPQRFPVRVGWAPRWHGPGVLVLGDAAHPMHPVRAQGINMALRDALVAARLLSPLAAGPLQHDAIDRLLPLVAGQRLPEIRRVQDWQAREAGLGVRLRQDRWLRGTLAATAPWIGPLARWRWIHQQHRLRQGLPGALTLPE